MKPLTPVLYTPSTLSTMGANLLHPYSSSLIAPLKWIKDQSYTGMFSVDPITGQAIKKKQYNK